MMRLKKTTINIATLLFLYITTASVNAQPPKTALDGLDGFGQMIQIDTNLHSFVGRPIWKIIIRDLEHGNNIPYIFDLTRGSQHWALFTYSKNYMIIASSMQLVAYQSSCNQYKNYRINNFCHLESQGRIIRGQSMYIRIDGDLSPNSNTYFCNVTSYANAN